MPGGSAVDAAIATNAALAVVAGHSCGLGGDAFWLIADPATAGVVALNGSGRSAAGATPEAAAAAGLTRMPERGPWSVTVPGAVDSWGEAHRRFGRLAWADLLAPAIELADGFPASAGLDRLPWNGPRWSSATMATGPARIDPEGRPWRLGERVRLPALGRTAAHPCRRGSECPVHGLARRARGHVSRRVPGPPSARPTWPPTGPTGACPIATTYRGLTSLSHPPNSCGAVALETLAILDHLEPPPPAAFDGLGVADARWVHLGLEASRIALADRDRWLTDIDAMEPGALERFLDRDRAAALAGVHRPRAGSAPSEPSVAAALAAAPSTCASRTATAAP